jgi:hypothetical protein
VTVTDLPEAGLKLKLMSSSREVPLPPPTIHTYQMTQDQQTRTQDRYAPEDLWSRSQVAGHWVDENGNELLLAAVTSPLPQGFTSVHVTREEYEKRRDEQPAPAAEWSAEDLTRWIRAFTGARDAKVESIPSPTTRLRNLASVTLEGSARVPYAYLFRLSRTAAGQQKAPLHWFFLMVVPEPSIAPEKVRKALSEEFLPSVTVSSETPRSGETGPSSRFQNAPGPGQTAKSPEFLASRKQVAESIRNMQDWWFVETENYIILSNLRARYRPMVRQLQEDIEFLRNAYEQILPPRKPISAVSVIRVFGTPEEYGTYINSYVSPDYGWSDGLWVPSKKELVVRPVEWGDNKTQRDQVLKVTYHEGFHQYLFYAFAQRSLPAWFNEGHATFFENSEIKSRRLEIREDEFRAARVDELVKAKAVDLQRLLLLSYPDFYAQNGPEELRTYHYSLAWALVYYLRKGAPLEDPPRHAGLLARYSDELWKNPDQQAATRLVFTSEALQTLQADFTSFWESRNRRSAARRNSVFKGLQTQEP